MSHRELIAKIIDCSRCGERFSSRAAFGLCPRCLLRTLEAEDEVESSETVRLFGDYELLSEIARGGMGTIYKARQRSLNRTVALKLITAGALASRDMVERFRTEAEAAARLSHPNIIPIYEVGEHEGQQFFSMELIDGPRLDQLPETGPGPPRRAAELLIKIAQAVHFAHQRGILHRDIKPGNILVDGNGEPRLMDFGLAKVLERESTITHTLTLLGTPSYMAPEQARGETRELTTAADIYSLGAVLYHLCAGVPPFAGGTTLETVRQVLESEPRRPSTLNAEVDRDLDTICLKCLEKEPEKRYPSALAFAEDLERWRRGEPIQARASSSFERAGKWVRRHPVVSGLSAGLVVIFLLGFAATFWQWRRAEQQTATARGAQAETEKLVDRLDLERADSRLATGERAEALALLCSVVRRQPANQIAAERLISFLSHNTFLLPIFEGFSHPDSNSLVPSPDGTRLLTCSKDGLVRIWEITTGRLERTIQHHSAVSEAAWSPDGRYIAAGFFDATARVWEAATGQEASPVLSHSFAPAVVFSWDGSRLISTAWLGRSVRIWNWRTGELINEIGELKPVRGLRVSPATDRFLVASTDELQLRDYQGTQFAAVSTNRLPNVGAWSPNGRVVATTTGIKGVVFYDGVTLERLPFQITEDVPEGRPTFSADGLWLMMGERLRVGQLRDLRTGRALNVPLLHGDGSRLAWLLPDGKRALTSGSDEFTARVCDARPGSVLAPPLRHSAQLTSAVFSPDGRRVLTTAVDQTARLWDAGSGEPLSVPLPHAAPVDQGFFSRDGARIATIARDRRVIVWDGSTGRLICELPHRSPLTTAAFGDDGNLLLSAAGTEAVLWDLSQAPPVAREFAHPAPVRSVAFRSKHFATGTGPPPSELVRTGGRVQIWEVGRENPIASIETPAGISTLSFSPAGESLAIGSSDGSAGAWSLSGNKWLFHSRRHDGGVTCVRFSSDGQWLISAGRDNVVHVSNSRTGISRYAPLPHDEAVTHAEFSRDARRLLTITSDGILRLWDASSGLPLTQLIREAAAPVSRWTPPAGATLLSADGERALAIVNDLSARVLEFPAPPAAAPLWLAELAEAIAGHRLTLDRQKVEVTWTDYLKLREHLATFPGDDFYSRWARWFFADRSKRTISPWSGRSVGEHADRLVKENTLDSLWEAVRLQPTNAVVLARLGAALSAQKAEGLFKFMDSGSFLIRRAVRLAPDAPEVRRIAHEHSLLP